MVGKQEEVGRPGGLSSQAMEPLSGVSTLRASIPDAKPRKGRPRNPEEERASFVVWGNVTERLGRHLRLMADANGRTMSKEVALRLERSIELDGDAAAPKPAPIKVVGESFHYIPKTRAANPPLNGCQAPSKMAYSVGETLSALGISRSSFYRAVASGEIRVSKFGNRTLVPASEISRIAEGRHG